MVCATSKGSDQPANTRSLIRAFASRLNTLCSKATDRTSFGISKLQSGCTGSSEFTHVSMPHFWKSHVVAQFYVSSTLLLLFVNDLRIISEVAEQYTRTYRVYHLYTFTLWRHIENARILNSVGEVRIALKY